MSLREIVLVHHTLLHFLPSAGALLLLWYIAVRSGQLEEPERARSLALRPEDNVPARARAHPAGESAVRQVVAYRSVAVAALGAVTVVGIIIPLVTALVASRIPAATAPGPSGQEPAP